jgi:DNA-dependent protein kinase catalytic subunit
LDQFSRSILFFFVKVYCAMYTPKLLKNCLLKEWSSINKTIVQSRMTKLQSLQSIIELNEFLKFIDANPTHLASSQSSRKQQPSLVEKIGGLAKFWLQTMPNAYSDPAQTWDDVITNRCLYFEYIQENYLKPFNNTTVARDDDDDDEQNYEHERKCLIEQIDKTKLIMKLNFANAANLQTNYKLALNKLQQTKFILKNQSVKFNDLKLNWIHCYTRTHLSNCKAINDHERSLKTFLDVATISKLVEYESCANDLFSINNTLYCDQQILNSQICRFVVDSFVNIRDVDKYLTNLDGKLLRQLFMYTCVDTNTKTDEFCGNYQKVIYF